MIDTIEELHGIDPKAQENIDAAAELHDVINKNLVTGNLQIPELTEKQINIILTALDVTYEM